MEGPQRSLRARLPRMDAGMRKSPKSSLFLDQFCRRLKVVKPEDTPDFTIDSDGGMTRPGDFTYNGHRVEIVTPDTAHLIGNFWQIKIDGVLRGNYLFSSARMAAEEAIKLIDAGLLP
jgi:hypothetical protein